MEAFEVKKPRAERTLSTASTRNRRNSKVGYILTMAGIVLFTSALLVALHFTREYTTLSQAISTLNSESAEKLEGRTCEPPFCNTKECVHIAAPMLEFMNPGADPCTDFYEYACGGFSRLKVVPYASDSYSLVKEAHEDLLIDIRKMMDKTSFENGGVSVKKMKKFYDSCMNYSMRAELKNMTLSFWFNDNGIVPDGYVLGNTIDFEHSLQWANFISHLEEYQIHTLFKPHFTGEENSAPEKMEIDCVLPYLNPEAYLNSSDDELNFQLMMYKESMNEALDLLKFEDEAKEEFIQDVMKIETDIARTVSIGDPSLYPHLTEEHKQQLREIWRSVVGNAVQDMDVVSTCKYDLESILGILNHAPNKSVVKYVLWRMVMELMQYMSPEFRDLHVHYMTKLPGFDYAYESKWKECTDMVRSEFGPVTAKSLFDNGYLQSEIINVVNADFREMKRRIALVFSTIEGVDEEVAKKFMDKLKGMKLETGYKEILNQEGLLDSFYGDVELSDNYFLNVINMKRFKTRKHLTNVWYAGNTDQAGELSLAQNPLGSSSGYDYISNTVHVDLGLFRSPVYVHSEEIPGYTTYAFSSILAREISRAFDATGCYYDAEGKKFEKIWWPSSMEQRYDSTLKCITSQMIQMDSDNQAEINVNDTRTLNNFIADMGAFFIPYESLKDHLQSHGSEKPLPGVPLNKKQTFYVQTAQTFCEIRSKPSSNPESKFLLSPRLRVNGAVSNMEDFGSIFNCPVDSAMNVQNKCSFLH